MGKRQFLTECYMWHVEGPANLVGWWGFMGVESVSPELNRIQTKKF